MIEPGCNFRKSDTVKLGSVTATDISQGKPITGRHRWSGSSESWGALPGALPTCGFSVVDEVVGDGIDIQKAIGSPSLRTKGRGRRTVGWLWNQRRDAAAVKTI